MSLDIYIISPEPIKKKSTGIFARIDGHTRELTKEEVIERFPDVDPNDIVENEFETKEFWHENITHNLHEMASKCLAEDGETTLAELLWRNNLIDKTKYIAQLYECLTVLRENPRFFKQFNPRNDWGTYEQLVEFVRLFIHALIDMPPGSTIEYSK